MTSGTELAAGTDLDATIAAAERDTIVVWRGEHLGFREVPERIARTSGRDARERLLASHVEALEALNPLYELRLARWTADGRPAAPGYDPDELAADAESLSMMSETEYYAALRRYLAFIGIEQGDGTVADLWHVLRGGAWSHWFADREVRRAIQLTGRVASDVEGLDGWRAAAAMLAGEPVGGDALVAGAVARAYATLVGSPEWLATELGVSADEVVAVADFAAFARLARLRQAIGGLQYEIRLYEADDPALARAYYAGIVGHIIGVAVPEAAFLHAIERPWVSAHVVRETILAAEIIEVLEQRHGTRWWREAAAAELISSVGGANNLDDALAQLGYDALDWRPLLRQIRTRLIGEMSGYGGPNITTRAGTRKV